MSATWRELDTVLKICENVQLLSVQPGARETIWKLIKDVNKAMSHWNNVSKGWCASIDTKATGQEAAVP